MKKSRLLCAVCACIFAFVITSANAAVVGFSVNTSFTQGGSLSDIPTEIIVLPVGSESLLLESDVSGNFIRLQVNTGSFSVVDTATGGFDNFLELFASGESVGVSTFKEAPGATQSAYAMTSNNIDPSWDNPFTGKFLGFQTSSGNYGYMEINWDYDSGSGVGTLSFLDGAVESVANAAIVLPASSAVPVPTAVWLFSSGLLGLIFSG